MTTLLQKPAPRYTLNRNRAYPVSAKPKTWSVQQVISTTTDEQSAKQRAFIQPVVEEVAAIIAKKVANVNDPDKVERYFKIVLEAVGSELFIGESIEIRRWPAKKAESR